MFAWTALKTDGRTPGARFCTIPAIGPESTSGSAARAPAAALSAAAAVAAPNTILALNRLITEPPGGLWLRRILERPARRRGRGRVRVTAAAVLAREVVL